MSNAESSPYKYDSDDRAAAFAVYRDICAGRFGFRHWADTRSGENEVPLVRVTVKNQWTGESRDIDGTFESLDIKLTSRFGGEVARLAPTPELDPRSEPSWGDDPYDMIISIDILEWVVSP